MTPRYQHLRVAKIRGICQYAKQKRRPTSTSVKKASREAQRAASSNILQPGQKVSVDLYQSTILWRLRHTKGKEAEDEKYAGGAILLDIASMFIFVKHQANLTVAATLTSKHAFEK
jgi:hypothetical protein